MLTLPSYEPTTLKVSFTDQFHKPFAAAPVDGVVAVANPAIASANLGADLVSIIVTPLSVGQTTVTYSGNGIATQADIEIAAPVVAQATITA